MRTPENLQRHELIGLPVVVVSSTNPTMVGLKGKVEDETRDTLLISGRRVPKAGNTFLFSVGGEKVEIMGVVLQGRPEDRIKKKVKR